MWRQFLVLRCTLCKWAAAQFCFQVDLGFVTNASFLSQLPLLAQCSIPVFFTGCVRSHFTECSGWLSHCFANLMHASSGGVRKLFKVKMSLLGHNRTGMMLPVRLHHTGCIINEIKSAGETSSGLSAIKKRYLESLFWCWRLQIVAISDDTCMSSAVSLYALL